MEKNNRKRREQRNWTSRELRSALSNSGKCSCAVGALHEAPADLVSFARVVLTTWLMVDEWVAV